MSQVSDRRAVLHFIKHLCNSHYNLRFFTLLSTNATQVHVYAICLVLITSVVILIGVKFCTRVHIGPGHKVSPIGVPPRGPKIPNFDVSKTVSRSVICQMGRNVGSTRAFQKCIAWDITPPGESPIKKNMYFCPRDRYLAQIGVKTCIMVGPKLCPVLAFLHFWRRYL